MTTLCDVIDNCIECPRYGDDCDGDKKTEHTDLISRADAIEAVCGDCTIENRETCERDGYCYEVRNLMALPSAETVPWSVADKIGEDRERLEERVSELEERLEWIL